MRVTDIIKQMAPRWVQLVLLALAWAILIGIPVGILAALRPGSVFDYAVRVLTGFGISLPSFSGRHASHLLRVGKARPAPDLGLGRRLAEQGAADSHPEPRADGLLRTAPARHTARDPRERLRADGPSKGPVAEAHRRVHALKNSLLPLIIVAGPMFGAMVTGSFIIENIFAIPGISKYFVASVIARDYTVVMGVTIVLAVMIICLNLLVDIAHHMLDPRLREA